MDKLNFDGSCAKSERKDGIWLGHQLEEWENCLTDEKGCVCPECEVYKENNLTKVYYCLDEGGR